MTQPPSKPLDITPVTEAVNRRLLELRKQEQFITQDGQRWHETEHIREERLRLLGRRV